MSTQPTNETRAAEFSARQLETLSFLAQQEHSRVRRAGPGSNPDGGWENRMVELEELIEVLDALPPSAPSPAAADAGEVQVATAIEIAKQVKDAALSALTGERVDHQYYVGRMDVLLDCLAARRLLDQTSIDFESHIHGAVAEVREGLGASGVGAGMYAEIELGRPMLDAIEDKLVAAFAARRLLDGARPDGGRMLPPVEHVAAKVHEAWMHAKRDDGITSRRSETGEELMVPFDQLSEAAKELDRASVRAVYDAIKALAAPAPAEPATAKAEAKKGDAT